MAYLTPCRHLFSSLWAQKETKLGAISLIDKHLQEVQKNIRDLRPLDTVIPEASMFGLPSAAMEIGVAIAKVQLLRPAKLPRTMGGLRGS